MNKVSAIELMVGLIVGGVVAMFARYVDASRETATILLFLTTFFVAIWLLLHRILSVNRVAFDACTRIGDMLRKLQLK